MMSDEFLLMRRHAIEFPSDEFALALDLALGIPERFVR